MLISFIRDWLVNHDWYSYLVDEMSGKKQITNSIKTDTISSEFNGHAKITTNQIYNYTNVPSYKTTRWKVPRGQEQSHVGIVWIYKWKEVIDSQ